MGNATAGNERLVPDHKPGDDGAEKDGPAGQDHAFRCAHVQAELPHQRGVHKIIGHAENTDDKARDKTRGQGFQQKAANAGSLYFLKIKQRWGKVFFEERHVLFQIRGGVQCGVRAGTFCLRCQQRG